MSHSSGQSEVRLENLLAAVTDAMLADEMEMDRIFERYAISRVEVEDLLNIIQRLKVTLVGVRPGRRYVARLKHDLMSQSEQPT
jgi:ethanolamine ammonia-lyase small subunit